MLRAARRRFRKWRKTRAPSSSRARTASGRISGVPSWGFPLRTTSGASPPLGHTRIANLSDTDDSDATGGEHHVARNELLLTHTPRFSPSRAATKGGKDDVDQPLPLPLVSDLAIGNRNGAPGRSRLGIAALALDLWVGDARDARIAGPRGELMREASVRLVQGISHWRALFVATTLFAMVGLKRCCSVATVETWGGTHPTAPAAAL
jgi:hypothetical protein